MELDYVLGSIVEMKKPHPCSNRTKQFEIVRVGADIKIKCLGCGAVIMLSRHVFNQKIRHFGMIKYLDDKMYKSIKNIKNAYLALALD